MTINLSGQRKQFILSLLQAGEFASPEEVIDEGLRLIEEHYQRRRKAENPDRSSQRQPATSEGKAAPAHKPIWEEIAEISATVPDEVWDALPTDLSEQHDHYIYGTPKRTDA